MLFWFCDNNKWWYISCIADMACYDSSITSGGDLKCTSTYSCAQSGGSTTSVTAATDIYLTGDLATEHVYSLSSTSGNGTVNLFLNILHLSTFSLICLIPSNTSWSI